MLNNLSKYVYEVYICKSVSVAAKKLFLSQPALSTAIKKAEAELGAPIFNRKTIPFTLTPEGKIYIDAIEKFLCLEQQLHDRVQDIHKIKGGVLNIAHSTNLGNTIVPKICKEFCKKHPYIEIHITNEKTAVMASMLEKNTADLVFIPTMESAPGFTTIPLLEENLIVVAPRDLDGLAPLLPYALSYEDIINRAFPEEKKIQDMSLFHKIEFVYAVPDSALFKKRKLLFGESISSPYIKINVPHHRLNYSFMESGFGALLTTDADIATMPPNDTLVYFALQHPLAKQTFSMAHGKAPDSPSFHLVNEFVNIAKTFFDCENPLKKLL